MNIIQAIIQKRGGGVLGFGSIVLVDGRTRVHCRSTVDDGYIAGVDLHLDDDTVIRFTYPDDQFDIARTLIKRGQDLSITLNFHLEIIKKCVTVTKEETINPYERRLIWDATDVHLGGRR